MVSARWTRRALACAVLVPSAMGWTTGVLRAGMSKVSMSQRTASYITMTGTPTIKTVGEVGTAEFTLSFHNGDQMISPWHDIPLEAGDGLFNLITEIPKFEKAKMEVDTKAELNPIVQDEKKGKPRFYHGPIFWNYGCLPQTWEDPGHKGGDEVMNCFGDNDPLDVVEIGSAALSMGSVTPVKPLGVLAMIDDGELDWKMIAISAADPLASKLSDVSDIEEHLPGTVSGIREWFRWYKTPDGKPVNQFGYGEKALNAQHALDVIEETNNFWKDLVAGKTSPGKLWVP